MSKENFFSELSNNRPFLKMAAEGFAGSGKTYTCARIAIGLHKHIGSVKPIVWYDTEKALKALKPVFENAAVRVLTRESRTLADLVTAINLCAGGLSDILVIDSLTHVYENYVQAYKDARAKQEKSASYDLTFRDWGIIKPGWKSQFSDLLVMSNVHIIFTGRAGYVYDWETGAGGKKELVKSGVKMKVENETEYEPDIVFLMERDEKERGKRITRTAFIKKDRTTMIDGRTFTNPVFENFLPAIKVLLDGRYNSNLPPETPDKFPLSDTGFDKIKIERQIFLEEIQGIFVQLWPGQTAKEKKLKTDIMEKVFNTRSWRAVETSDLDKLKHGLMVLADFKEDAAAYIKAQLAAGLDVSDEHILSLVKLDILSNIPPE